MKRILAIALCVSLPCLGQDLAKLDETPILDIRPIQVGEASPVTGRVIELKSYILLAQRVKEADLIINDPPVTAPPVALFAVIGGLGLVGGVVLGLVISGIVKR